MLPPRNTLISQPAGDKPTPASRRPPHAAASPCSVSHLSAPLETALCLGERLAALIMRWLQAATPHETQAVWLGLLTLVNAHKQTADVETLKTHRQSDAKHRKLRTERTDNPHTCLREV